MDDLDKNNPDVWKYGFYCNPNDPSLFAYDSNSVGSSKMAFNFGHKKAPFVIITFVVIVVGFILFVVLS